MMTFRNNSPSRTGNAHRSTACRTLDPIHILSVALTSSFALGDRNYLLSRLSLHYLLLQGFSAILFNCSSAVRSGPCLGLFES